MSTSRLLIICFLGILISGCNSDDPGNESNTNSEVIINPQDSSPPEQTESLAISEEDAKYLQDVEHFGGFVLGDLAFPKINQAIEKEQWERFSTFFAPDFEGQLFVWENGTESDFDFAYFKNWNSESPKDSLNKSEFVAAIRELRERFQTLERSGFKVMQMMPESHGKFDEPW